jgi:hypothetical protein
MIKSIAISKPQPFPVVLKYTDIRSYVATGVFVAMAVLVPWIFHQYHLAGPTFLPMHIFILIAGLVFGWRAGLIVGLLTPLASYTISGMPALQILPQTAAELSTYGLVAGILRERFNLRVIWSLLGAMVAGRLALCLAVLGIYYFVGEIYSPLGLEAKPLSVLFSVVKQGWPGIVIQLAFIPVIIWLGEKLITKTSKNR